MEIFFVAVLIKSKDNQNTEATRRRQLRITAEVEVGVAVVDEDDENEQIVNNKPPPIIKKNSSDLMFGRPTWFCAYNFDGCGYKSGSRRRS